MSDARKIAKLDALYESTMAELRSSAAPKTYKIEDVDPTAVGREFSLTELSRLGDRICRFTLAHGCSPIFGDAVANISCSTVSVFLRGLREFTMSEKLRIELSRGVKHKSQANKLKVVEYHANRVARAHACQLYRKFVVEFTELVVAQDVRMHVKANMLHWASSTFRCEECGKGEGKHRRPGLELESIIKRLETEQ